MSASTFSRHQFVPHGLNHLACSCLLPDGWIVVPIPEETYDLDNPGVFIPVVVCMAQYGAVVFTIAARPAFEDGTVQDWCEYLCAQQQMAVEQIREARVNRMPCILVDATMSSDLGPMRSRSVFLEDGKRLYNIGALAPEAIWSSVEADFDRLLGAFTLDEVHGLTAAPLRAMSNEPVINLSNNSAAVASADDLAIATVAEDHEAPPERAPSGDATSADHERPAQAADVASADDAATLDPEHVINARLRDAGVGLVPRVLQVVDEEKFAVIGAGAIEATFRAPFGWHVLDDGRRTLVFDPEADIQINLNLRAATAAEHHALLQGIGDELARENPQALFLKLEILGFPCLAVRDLLIDGESLDQAYLACASKRSDLALVCRVTATREHMTRAMNTAEVILTSLA